jgi:nucleotide sugar dehydrogenase
MLPDKKPNVKIAVIGGGFVGITLAARLLEVENLHITVFDDDPVKIENFKANNYLVDEPGLQEILVEAEKLGNFTFNVVNNAATFNSIFICIGSPKNQNPQERDQNFKMILTKYLPKLATNGMIFLRSTVEIGTTERLSKYLDSTNRSDASIHFAPERTAEGVALVELKILPQLLGTPKNAHSTSEAKSFLANLNFEVVQTENSQTAELAKLICNTWRDVTFGFSNEVALIAESIGANALDAIRAANYNYPRASIPMPGPVGGPCLSKDTTILFNGISDAQISLNSVMLAARRTNEHIEERLLDALKVCKKSGAQALKLCIIGASFKGRPQTNDVRNGVAVNLIEKIHQENLPIKITIWDPVISKLDLGKLGHMLETSLDDLSPDLVLISNNSNFESNQDFMKFIRSLDSTVCVFDLWQLTEKIIGIKAKIFQLGKSWIDVNVNK